jgi:ribosomal protein L9
MDANQLTSLFGLGGLAASAYLPYQESGTQIDYLKGQIPEYLKEAQNITNQAVEEAQFTPFTVTSGMGGLGSVGSGGSINLGLSTPESAFMQSMFGNAAGMMGSLGASPNLYGMDSSNFLQAQQALQGVNAVDPTFAAQRGQTADLYQRQLNQYGQPAEQLGGLTSQALEQAQQGLSTAGSVSADSIYKQMEAMQNPERERQQLQLENRLAAQGRLGVNTAAYGGTPEQLAMQKAIEEQRSSNSLNAITTAQNVANQEQQRAMGLANLGMAGTSQQQALTSGQLQNLLATQGQDISSAMAQQGLQTGSMNIGSGMFGLGTQAAMLPSTMQSAQLGNMANMMGLSYLPQQQQLSMLSAASPYSQLATSAALSRAEQLSAGGKYGLEALVGGDQTVGALEGARVNALADTLQGLFTATGASQTSPFETLVGNLLGESNG